MCSLGNHVPLSYSFHSVSHGEFWLSSPWIAMWTWLDAACWWQSHLPSPDAFVVLANSPTDLLPSSLSPKYFSINLFPLPISCPAGTEASHLLLLSVSSLSPSLAQGHVPFQVPSYSLGPCLISASTFLLPAPLSRPSLVQIHNQFQCQS